MVNRIDTQRLDRGTSQIELRPISAQYKSAVRAATTANIVLSGLQTIDGVALAAGDRVLVKNQSAAAENGIYIAAAVTWTRADDADADAKVKSAMVVPIEEGTTQKGTLWSLTAPNPITVGSTALSFVQTDRGPAATFVVGTTLERADFTSIQAAVDALPSVGGEIFVREGTYNLSVTVTLPTGKKIKIRGAGDSTVINLGTNAIAAFTGAGGSTVQTYEFESFRLNGQNAGGQIVFVSANEGTTYTDWQNVNFGTPDLGGELGVIEKGIRNASVAGTIIATMVDCRWILASTAAARHFDSASGQNIYVTMTGCEMFTEAGSPGGGANVGVTLFASNCRLKFDGAASFSDLRLVGCRVEGTPAGGISIGSAVFAPPAVQGCSFSRGTSPTRWIDVPTGVDGAVIVGNNFDPFTSEAVRIGATGAVISDNKNCKVTENGTGQSNRYATNSGFDGSTILGPSSVVEGWNTRLATATLTLDESHRTVLVDASAGPVTVNLPTAASARYRTYTVNKIDSSANAVTIDPAGTETINDATTLVISTQYTSRTFQSDGAEWWIV